MKRKILLDRNWSAAEVPTCVGEREDRMSILFLAVWRSPPVESLGIPVAVNSIDSEGVIDPTQ